MGAAASMRAAAHDLANLLTAINGLCEMGRRDAARGDLAKAVERLARVGEVAADCSAILRSVMTATPAVPGQFELNDLARKVAKQTEEELAARSIELRLNLAADDFWIRGDAMDLQRALFNLVINARAAIGPRGGAIVIKVRRPEWVFPDPNATGILLEVTDTGCGMSQEEVTQLWKCAPVGEHGHGLFIVRRTVEECGGRLTLESLKWQGTTFTIWLPLTNATAAGTKAA